MSIMYFVNVSNSLSWKVWKTLAGGTLTFICFDNDRVSIPPSSEVDIFFQFRNVLVLIESLKLFSDLSS